MAEYALLRARRRERLVLSTRRSIYEYLNVMPSITVKNALSPKPKNVPEKKLLLWVQGQRD